MYIEQHTRTKINPSKSTKPPKAIQSTSNKIETKITHATTFRQHIRTRRQDSLELQNFEMNNVNILDKLTSSLSPGSSLFTTPKIVFEETIEEDPIIALENKLLPPPKYKTFLKAIEQDPIGADRLLITSKDDRSRALDILLSHYKTLMNRHALLFNTGDLESDNTTLQRCVEKYLFEETNIYEHIFFENHQDRKINEDIFERLQSFSTFLLPVHMGLPNEMESDPIWHRSIKIIRGINQFKTLYGKLGCIQEGLKSMFQMNCFKKEDMCADLFLSAIIFLLARAYPRNLHSNVNVLSKYGLESELYQHCQINEMGFLFTNFQCAYLFWKDLNLSELDQMFQMLDVNKQQQIKTKLNMFRHCRRPSTQDLGNCSIAWNYFQEESNINQ